MFFFRSNFYTLNNKKKIFFHIINKLKINKVYFEMFTTFATRQKKDTYKLLKINTKCEKQKYSNNYIVIVFCVFWWGTGKIENY